MERRMTGAQTLMSRWRRRSGTAQGHRRSAQEQADEAWKKVVRLDVVEKQEQAVVCWPGLMPPRPG